MTDNAAGAPDIAARLDRIPPLPIHVRWAVTVGIGVLLDGFTTLTVAAALTVLITTLHIDFARVGVLISASFFGMFVGAIACGAASERFGRKRIFILAVALFGLLSLLTACAWDFASLFWLRAIQGLGLGGAVPVAAALIAECLPARVRGKTFSLTYALLFALGYVLAPLAGLVCIGIFGPQFGWRALFALAGLALPFAFIAARILPESPRWLASKGRLPEANALLQTLEDHARAAGRALETPTTTHPLQQPRASRLAEVFKGVHLRRTMLTWTLFFCIYFVQYGLNAWLPTLYVKVGGLPPQNALALAVANGLIALTAAVVFGTTVDRVGRKTWFVIGFTLSLIGTLCAITALGLFHVAAWPALFSAAVLLTAGTSVNAGSIYLYAPELFPTRMRAWATSTGSAASRIGSIVAPLAIGFLLQSGFGLLSVFALLGVICLAGLIAIVTAGIETKQRRLEDLAT